MSGHAHDSFDWAGRLAALRRGDRIAASALRTVAERLTADLPPGAVIADIGCGSGGMGVAFARALGRRGGGTLVLADATEELLTAAVEAVGGLTEVADGRVAVRSRLVDAASETLSVELGPVDLVWASHMVHHLRDQLLGVRALAALVRPGGRLALAEGGLETRCLPWDLGVGEPGFGGRLSAAGGRWFEKMRADIPGGVRMPTGWNRALADAGLTDVTAFSYLVDHPAPVSADVREAIVSWLEFGVGSAEDWLSADDRGVLARLLDPDDEAYVGRRDDAFYLSGGTVHLGTRSLVASTPMT